MKTLVGRYGLRVVPETPQDEAWLEEVLGLRKAGDSIPLMRVNAIGLMCWAYAEALVYPDMKEEKKV